MKGNFGLQETHLSDAVSSSCCPWFSYTHASIWRNFQSALIAFHNLLSPLAWFIYILIDNMNLLTVPQREVQPLMLELHSAPAGLVVEAPAVMLIAEKIMGILNTWDT